MSLSVTIYRGIISVGNALHSPLLLAIRLIWGWLFFETGLGKVQNIAPIISYFQTLGLPFPDITAHFVGWLELIGGIFLFFGFASRLICIPLMCSMSVAFITAHRIVVEMFFSDTESFVMQDTFTYLFAAILIFVFGPGYISLDALIKRIFFKEKVT